VGWFESLFGIPLRFTAAVLVLLGIGSIFTMPTALFHDQYSVGAVI